MSLTKTQTKQRILLGITGSIAAYKSCELVRRLVDVGCEVQVVMTKAALQFVSSMTLQALSGCQIRHALVDEEAELAMSHIELARWADLILIAPASANALAHLAQGVAHELLYAVCLATQAPVVVVPAMNQRMWHHPATQANVACLKSRGVRFIGPDSGVQACGDEGLGRMAEVDNILNELWTEPCSSHGRGRRILVTAGATREHLDPVRYLSNRSSGKMGYALAQAAQSMGAEVTLISGPGHLPCPNGVSRQWVETAQEMYQAVLSHVDDLDIILAVAAVADYRCEKPAPEKLKKTKQSYKLSLVPNVDILYEIGQLPEHPYLVGFAAETSDLLQYAKEKLQKKNLDMIVANDVSQKGVGFDSEYNQVIVLTDTIQQDFPKQPKLTLAYQLMDFIFQQHQNKE